MIDFIAGNWQWLLIVLYASVPVVWIGVWRELHGDWHEDMGLTLLWPVMLAVAMVWGAVWLLTWLGRGPAMLVRHIGRRRERRSNLPTARTVKEAT